MLTVFLKSAKIFVADRLEVLSVLKHRKENGLHYMQYTRSEPRVTVRHDGEISIFEITGYFTEDSAEGIDAAYDQSANAAKILLRFDRQSFITSSGFGVIVKLVWKARNRGQVLRVAHPSNQMRHVFDIIGLSQSIDIFASEEIALADF